MNKNNPSNVTLNNGNPLPPIPPLNKNPIYSTNHNGTSSQSQSQSTTTTTVKHTQHFISSSKIFDMRRVKKIRRLDRKIRSIESGTSKELQREINKIEREKQLKLQQLRESKVIEMNDSDLRYNLIKTEILKDMTDKKKTLQNHCIRELQRIKTRIINNYKSNEKPIFTIDSINSNSNKLIKILINRKFKYSFSNINYDILSIFNNWQNEISFNTKRTTRAATKNKRQTGFNKSIYTSTDLSRIRFHLREDEIKYDLKKLLNAEQKLLNSHSHTIDNHISNITNKLGPLNDPCIDDPLYPRMTRRTRVARVNYNNSIFSYINGNNCNSNNCNSNNSNQNNNNNGYNMYHSQDVHFYENGNKSGKIYYTNNDNEMILIPGEERGHNVIISNFIVNHGEIIRLNYLGNNITIDAYVVSIKKNQLSAVTLVGKKRKRIWYKELRIGKINIAPATAYR